MNSPLAGNYEDVFHAVKAGHGVEYDFVNGPLVHYYRFNFHGQIYGFSQSGHFHNLAFREYLFRPL